MCRSFTCFERRTRRKKVAQEHAHVHFPELAWQQQEQLPVTINKPTSLVLCVSGTIEVIL